MLLKNARHVLFFDLAMSPHPADAPVVPFEELYPHLEARAQNQEAVDIIDAERRIVRLLEAKKIKLKDGSEAAALLFCLGDRDKADPGVTNFQTGAVRVFEKEEAEVGGLSAHALIRLSPTKQNGVLYPMMLEDVTGFGRSVIQNFLRGQFRIICDQLDYHFKREGNQKIKTRPMAEMNGHASDQLKNSLDEGRLLNVELVEYIEAKMGFDEAKFIKTARRELSFSISNALPEGDGLKFVEKVKLWAANNGYDTMRVRWKDPEVARTQSAKIETAKQDAGEAFFTKTAEVKVKQSLADICDSISDELVAEMAKHMV